MERDKKNRLGVSRFFCGNVSGDDFERFDLTAIIAVENSKLYESKIKIINITSPIKNYSFVNT